MKLAAGPMNRAVIVFLGLTEDTVLHGLPALRGVDVAVVQADDRYHAHFGHAQVFWSRFITDEERQCLAEFVRDENVIGFHGIAGSSFVVQLAVSIYTPLNFCLCFIRSLFE